MIAMRGEPLGRGLELVRVLTERNLAVRYRGSSLGILWSALNPLAMTAVYAAIFARAFAPAYGNSPWLYAAYLYVALVAVQFFTASTATALVTVVGNAALVGKVRVPHAVFPLSAVAAYAVQMLLSALPIMIGIAIWQRADVLRLLLLPVPLAALFAGALGVGAATSAAYVYFRDVPHVYDLVTFLLWITTPVFYPISIVPPAVRSVLVWNPLFPMVQTLRAVLLGTAIDPWLLGLAVLWGAVLALGGLLAFRLTRPGFADRL